MWTSPITNTTRATENRKGEGLWNSYKEAFSIRRIGYREHNPKKSSKIVLFTQILIEHQSSPQYLPPLLTKNVVLTLHPHAASSSSPHHVGSDKAGPIHGYALAQSSFHPPVTDFTTGAQMVKRVDADSAYTITEGDTVKRHDADTAYTITEEDTYKRNDADTAYTITEGDAYKRSDADTAYTITE